MVELTTTNHQKGKITVSKDVLRDIAKTAALEVDGVIQPVETMYSDFNPKKYAKSLQPKWVKIDTDPQLEITLNLTIKNGYKVPDVSAAVQQKVKTEIETMTGIDVFTVNIVAAGISA